MRGSKNEAKIEQKWAFLPNFPLSSQRLVLKCMEMKCNNVDGLTFHSRSFWMGLGSQRGHSGAPKQGKKKSKMGFSALVSILQSRVSPAIHGNEV